ncbi:MAG: replication factor C large subunit, partial [Candidatus Heimdallarchaeota archaeon]
IRDASVPIICTANEAYASKLSPLRKVAKVIAYQPVHVDAIIKILKKIAKSQKFELQTDDVQFLAEQAHGDLRSAINDLEGIIHQLASGKVKDFELLKPNRDQTKHIQEALGQLMA